MRTVSCTSRKSHMIRHLGYTDTNVAIDTRARTLSARSNCAQVYRIYVHYETMRVAQ